MVVNIFVGEEIINKIGNYLFSVLIGDKCKEKKINQGIKVLLFEVRCKVMILIE